ncbi:uncharacterized protein LOC124807880 [Hydra vulgaris]|uniref:uncharacterized protein LOC124807880 n=1 Tax=Hydra vulgaris TaxID=6087 RepID=UPI001F5FED71|nr:uncharacterized protein LOC124807880 [Hydra vulgaris]
MENTFFCSICHLTTISLSKLLRHLTVFHSHDFNFNVECCYTSCKKTFYKINSFRKHVYRYHKNYGLKQKGNDHHVSVVGKEELIFSCDTSKVVVDSYSLFLKIVSELKYCVGLMFLKLREKHVVSSQVHIEFVSDFKELFQTFLTSYNNVIEKCLPMPIDATFKSILDSDLLCDVFSHFMNEYQLVKFCKNTLSMVEPLEVKIIDTNKKVHKFHYISLKRNLEKILSNEEVFNEFGSYLNKVTISDTNKDNLSDFHDGEIFKKHPLFSTDPTVIRIHLFIDEFESVNPLGSKRGKQIIGIYYTIGNLHPRYRSQMSQVHLAALVRSNILKKTSYSEIMKPLIDELIELSNNGIILKTNSMTHSLKVSLATVSADNLGAHALAGFRCCFSSGRVCRTCLVHFETIRLKQYHIDCYLRTDHNYNQQLNAINKFPVNKSVYGINQSCCLNNLPFFNVLESFPPDIHHDFLEGIVPMVLKLVIQKLISHNIISLKQLNYEICNFSFGFNDKKSKPVPLSVSVLSKKGRIIGKASELWCFFRCLPIIIFGYISSFNDDCPAYWLVYLELRNIADIIFSPVIKRDSLGYLAYMIASFVNSFVDIWPGNFIPKMHYMVHYPRQIELFGPLRHLWCMRFEAKHNYFKCLSCVVSNFKNITYTLSKRHQMRQCCELNSVDFMKIEQHNQRNGIIISLTSLPEGLQVELTHNFLLDQNTQLWKVTNVSVNHCSYQTGDFIVLNILDDGTPIFMSLKYILKINGLWFLCGKLCSCEKFLFYLHAYNLIEISSWVVILSGQEVSHEPLDGYLMSDGQLLVTLRSLATK